MNNNYQTKWQPWSEARYQELTGSNLTDTTEFSAIREKIMQINAAIAELRKQVTEQGFANHDDEIWFMKVVRPKLLSLQHIYGEWLLIESNLPKSTERQLLNYYIEGLNAANRFLHLNYGLYQYYQMELTEMDHYYFLRGEGSESSSHLPMADPVFGTRVSDLFARFMAMEILRENILLRIRQMGGLSLLDGWKAPFTSNPIQWTGSTINLIELIYGLYYSGQLNGGQATLKDITRLMEDIFQVELRRIWRRFIDIKRRKCLSPTHLLDRMRSGIMAAVDDDLAYKPQKNQNNFTR